jgi:hypothetical protein
MSATLTIPTLDEFLAAPVEAVSAVAPRSMVYAPGGTRRSATFAGVEPWSAEYIRLGQDKVTACLEVLFRYGVQNVFMPIIIAGHVNEVEDIEQQLLLPIGGFVTDPYLLQMVGEHGWRIKLAPCAYTHVLQPYIQRLQEYSSEDAKQTWWMTVTPSYESWWSSLIGLAKSDQVLTRTDAIYAMYGEHIPPISLCLAFGKPMLSPDLLPPLLMDNVQCYWSQQAGYTLSDQQFRTVLYDFAYLRQTWQKNKTARAKEAQAQQKFWEQEVILGLGKRIGPYWYPDLS